LIGSIPVSRLGAVAGRNNGRRAPSNLSTLSRPAATRLSRSWVATPRYPSSYRHRPRALPADEKKAPLANLCSRLVVNEYPRDPSIPERPAHTVPTVVSVAFPSPAAQAAVGSASSAPAPDSRKRHLRPRVAAQLLLCLPAVTTIAAALAGCPLPLGSRHDPRLSVVGPGASRAVWSLTLPVTPPT
jgi:hypothetical protein